MTDWEQLDAVYGSAAGIPALLERAATVTEWGAPVWDELWSELYHQGTVVLASYAALPALARIAVSRPDVVLDPALILAASIVASTDGPAESSELRDRYAKDIASLVPVAEHKLGLVHDRADFIYALQSLAAFEDLSVWQRGLEGLVNDEVELECPLCEEHLYLELRQSVFVVTTDPHSVADALPVRPADPAALGRAEARLVELCRAHDQDGVGQSLLQLFGTACCASCGVDFVVAEALA